MSKLYYVIEKYTQQTDNTSPVEYDPDFSGVSNILDDNWDGTEKVISVVAVKDSLAEAETIKQDLLNKWLGIRDEYCVEIKCKDSDNAGS